MSISLALGYPIFAANQLLKHTDLNNLANYLEQQTRLTRTQLIGMGIVSGLLVQLDPSRKALKISDGCGLTSEGDVIRYRVLPETQPFSHVWKRQVSLGIFGIADRSEERVWVYELLTQQAAFLVPEPEPVFALDSVSELEEQIVVAVYAHQDDPRTGCLVDCDDHGSDRCFQLRFLLLSKTPATEATSGAPWLDVTSLLQAVPQTEVDPGNLLQSWYDLPDCQIQRIGHQLDDIQSFDDLQNTYGQICEDAITHYLKPALTGLHKRFAVLLADDANPSAGIKRLELMLKGFLGTLDPSTKALQSPAPAYGLQYFYDYLVDLVAAYQELKDELFDLVVDCQPTTGQFPKYLLLGEVKGSPPVGDRRRPYRHGFTHPPIYNHRSDRLQAARHLYSRLLQMIRGFVLLPSNKTPVKITPSRRRSTPLGDQAIPYYYFYPDLLTYWNYDAARKLRQEHLPAYFTPKSQDSQAPTPGHDLIHRTDQTDFFRVEGHVGLTLEDAIATIKQYRQDFNLPFDLATARLGQGNTGNALLKGYFGDLSIRFGQIKDEWKNRYSEWQKAYQQIRPNASTPDGEEAEAETEAETSESEARLAAQVQLILNEIDTRFLNGDNDLSEISPDLMTNDLIRWASQPENYQFQKITDVDNPYQLIVIGDNRNTVAVVPDSETQEEPYRFYFTSPDTLTINQNRVINTFATRFALEFATFEITPVEPTAAEAEVQFQFGINSGQENIELFEGEEDQADIENLPLVLQDQSTYTFAELLERYHDLDFLFNFLRWFAQPLKAKSPSENPSEDRPEDAEFGRPLGIKKDSEYAEFGQTIQLVPYYELRALFDEYLRRLERVEALQNFSEYHRQNKGLDHLGGVPEGGTLVLIYTNDPAVIQQLVDSELSATRIAESWVTEIEQKAVFPKNLLPANEAESSDAEQVSEKTLEVRQPSIRVGDSLLRRFNERSASLISSGLRSQSWIEAANSRLVKLPPANLSDITEQQSQNLVIADFCLPYKTYDPYSYFTALPRPLVRLTKDGAPYEQAFCSGDTTLYEFILDPPGGLLRGGDGLVATPAGQLAFQPSSIDHAIDEPTSLTFFYSVNGVSSSLSLLVLPTIDAVLTLPDEGDNRLFCLGLDEARSLRFNLSPAGGELRQAIAAEPETPITLNDQGEYDLQQIPIPPDRPSVSVRFIYRIADSVDICAGSDAELTVTVMRAPAIAITYPTNDAGQAIGTLVYSNPEDCSDLRLQVEFSGSSADTITAYQWQLAEAVVATGATATLTLPYTNAVHTVTLITTLQEPETGQTCERRQSVQVELASLDATWAFDDKTLPRRDNQGVEEIILCRLQPTVSTETSVAYQQLLTVQQPGGAFQVKSDRPPIIRVPGDDISPITPTLPTRPITPPPLEPAVPSTPGTPTPITPPLRPSDRPPITLFRDVEVRLIEGDRPCADQTQYYLEFTHATPGRYGITYRLPDGSTFRQYVRVEAIPIGRFTLSTTPHQITYDRNNRPHGQFLLQVDAVIPAPEENPELRFVWQVTAGDRPTQSATYAQMREGMPFSYGDTIDLGDTILAVLSISSQGGQCVSTSEPVTLQTEVVPVGNFTLGTQIDPTQTDRFLLRLDDVTPTPDEHPNLDYGFEVSINNQSGSLPISAIGQDIPIPYRDTIRPGDPITAVLRIRSPLSQVFTESPLQRSSVPFQVRELRWFLFRADGLITRPDQPRQFQLSDNGTLSRGTVITLRRQTLISVFRLDIVAEVFPAAGSVQFILRSQESVREPVSSSTDSDPPFALSWTPAAGRYVITATPYSQPNGQGVAGAALSIPFTVTSEGGSGPVGPLEPLDPDRPIRPVEPLNPDQPIRPVEPLNPDQPIRPVEPLNPDQPIR